MEFDVDSKNTKLGQFIQSLMPSMIEQLSLTRSQRAVLVKVTSDTSDLDEGMHGATHNIEIADCYLVLIKQPKRITKQSLLELGVTLAHEMVHVRQLALGQLKFLSNQNRIWMGKRYNTNRTHYLDQPWEIDAFSRQELVFRRAIEV